jgi:hypothetical protein
MLFLVKDLPEIIMKGIDHIVTKEHSGFFAWPTVFLGCAVGIGFFGSIVLTYLGFIALALCSCLNFILCYLAFTPLHEAVQPISSTKPNFSYAHCALAFAFGKGGKKTGIRVPLT